MGPIQLPLSRAFAEHEIVKSREEMKLVQMWGNPASAPEYR